MCFGLSMAIEVAAASRNQCGGRRGRTPILYVDDRPRQRLFFELGSDFRNLDRVEGSDLIWWRIGDVARALAARENWSMNFEITLKPRRQRRGEIAS